MRGPRVLVPVLAFTALVVTACNGDSGDEPGALSKSEFASKANALCADTEMERTRLIQQLPPQPSGQTVTQTFQQLARADRELVRRVDALVPPAAEQDQVDRILDGWRQRAELEESNATQASQSLASFTADVAQIDATVAPIASELGMTQCGQGAS